MAGAIDALTVGAYIIRFGYLTMLVFAPARLLRQQGQEAKDLPWGVPDGIINGAGI
jgi:hypothetical protein